MSKAQIVKTTSGIVKGQNIEFLNQTITNGPTVQTGIGTVMGQLIPMLGQNIEQYLGIPYAVPPVRSLRFAKPQPILTPIQGIIDATKRKYSCLQPFLPGFGYFEGIGDKSEDCLVLNIWTQQQNSTAHKLKPVMFWIHGGAYNFGSIFQTFFNGSVLATHDVVFVSVNYRLGWFGFLYGGDESAPGNVGLFDQNLALRWVRENIHLFGGDKNQITIMGQSAGSWSVSAHIYSPISKGLFKRAIMMAGANLYNKHRDVINKEEALKKAKALAKLFGCEDDSNWLQCLRAQNPRDLRWYSYDFVFPVVDTEFLPLMARTALEQGQFSKDVDLLGGFAQDEGTILFYLFAKEYLLVPYFHPLIFDYYLDKLDSTFHNIDKRKIRKYYLGNINMQNSTAIRKKIYELTGDILMKCPTYHFAKLYAQHSSPETNVFFYELTHKTYHFLSDLRNNLLLKYSPLYNLYANQGIYHTSDIPLLFGQPFLNPNTCSPEDTKFTEEYMKLFTDFAKNGKPDPKWPKLVGNGSHSAFESIRNLHPAHPESYKKDLFKDSCNGVWKDYF